MRRGAVLAVAAALSLGLLTVLAVRADVPAPSARAAAAETDPARLVGAWWVAGSEVLTDRLMVLLPSGEARVYGSDTCELMGGWSATASGLVTLQINAASGGCGGDLAPVWAFASGIQRFVVSELGLVRLTDVQGSTVAAMTSAESPGTWPKAAAADGELVLALDAPYPGPPEAGRPPDGVVRVSIDVLTSGRWVPVSTVGSDRRPDATRPHARFASDGTWTGADGCNGQGGRWSMDPATGEWLASTMGQTAIGCDNVDVASMVAPARSVGLDGDELVFHDAEGTETGRFVREGTPVE